MISSKSKIQNIDEYIGSFPKDVQKFPKHFEEKLI